MTVEQTIFITIVTAIITSTFTYLGYFRKARADLEKEYQMRVNEQRWLVYKDFVGIVSTLDSKSEPASLVDVTRELLLVASDDVVKSYNNFMMQSTPDNIENLAMNVVREMRKDLGYNTTISNEDLMSLRNSVFNLKERLQRGNL